MIRFKLTDRPVWNWYAETGPGVSWSDLTTPVRGTKFNYLFQAGTGFMRRVGSNSHVLVAYRFFHLSNNGRAGRDHNPDLEMMGAYAGVVVFLLRTHHESHIVTLSLLLVIPATFAGIEQAPAL